MQRILLIDDSEHDRELVVTMLEGLYALDTADGWVKAMPLIFSGYDLILLDIHMPGVQGDEVAKTWNDSLLNGASLQIVLFSASDEHYLRKRAKEVGAIGYIQKTHDAKILKNQIAKHLRKKHETT